jgi:type II secretory pathway pseudopilin PulG
MITVGIIGITGASAMTLSARSFNLLRSANESTLASQSIQERMEQLRSAGWTTLTSREIPGADDDSTSEDTSDSDGDLTTEVLTETTEFPDDLGDVAESDPGLIVVLAQALGSTVDLQNPVETVTVTKYPEGSTAIRVRRNADGTTDILSHNADSSMTTWSEWSCNLAGKVKRLGAPG